MERGNIYWVDLGTTKGSEINKLRPCVLVGVTALNQVRRTVVVVPLSTSAKARPPLIIPLKCLEKNVVAVCDQIRAIDKTRLVKSAGALSKHELKNLDEAIRQILGL